MRRTIKLKDIEGLPEDVANLLEYPLSDAFETISGMVDDATDAGKRLRLEAVCNRIKSELIFQTPDGSVLDSIPDQYRPVCVTMRYNTLRWYARVFSVILWKTPLRKVMIKKGFVDPFKAPVVVIVPIARGRR